MLRVVICSWSKALPSSVTEVEKCAALPGLVMIKT